MEFKHYMEPERYLVCYTAESTPREMQVGDKLTDEFGGEYECKKLDNGGVTRTYESRKMFKVGQKDPRTVAYP